MTKSIIQTIQSELPGLYARALAAAETHQNADELPWKGRHEQMMAARGGLYLEAVGEGHLFVWVNEGQIFSSETRPDDIPIRAALKGEPQAIDITVHAPEAQAALNEPEALEAAAFLASADVMKTVERFPMRGEFKVVGVPEVDEVSIAVAIPGPEVTGDHDFSVTARFDDLEDVRNGDLAPRKLLMGGKLRFQGGYTPFLQLGLEILKQLRL